MGALKPFSHHGLLLVASMRAGMLSTVTSLRKELTLSSASVN
jgi:hypothetical protein